MTKLWSVTFNGHAWVDSLDAFINSTRCIGSFLSAVRKLVTETGLIVYAARSAIIATGVVYSFSPTSHEHWMYKPGWAIKNSPASVALKSAKIHFQPGLPCIPLGSSWRSPRSPHSSVQLDSKISNVTDRRTDGRHAISIPRYALVHRAVKRPKSIRPVSQLRRNKSVTSPPQVGNLPVYGEVTGHTGKRV